MVNFVVILCNLKGRSLARRSLETRRTLYPWVDVSARRVSAHRMPQLSIILQGFIYIHFKDSVNSVRYFLLLAAYRRIGVRRVQNRSTLDCKAVFKVSEVSRLCSPSLRRKRIS